MKCPNCENSIDEKSEVCEWCGINIEAFKAEQEAEALRLAEERAASRKRNDARKQETGEETLQSEPVSEKGDMNSDYPSVKKQHEAAKQRHFSRIKLIICSISGIAAIIGVLGLINFLRYPDRRYDEVFLIGDMVEYDFYGVEKNGKRGVVSGLSIERLFLVYMMVYSDFLKVYLL